MISNFYLQLYAYFFNFIKVVLIFFVFGLCAAATTKQTTKAPAPKKDIKEKRDAPIAATYNYEAPQKSFQIPIHAQQQKSSSADYYSAAQKVAPVEYHQAPQKGVTYEYHQSPQKSASAEYYLASQKVAPLDHYQQKPQAALNVQPQQHHYVSAPQQQQQQHSYESAYEAAPQQQYHEVPQQQLFEPASDYQASAEYQGSLESLFGDQYKGLNDFTYSYPGFESYGHMPIVHFNQDSHKVNSAVVNVPGLKTQSYSTYKPSPYQQQQQQVFSFGSPSPAYSFPAHSYAIPSQNSFANYASSAPSAPAAGQSSYYGFSQSPSAIFVPQTISISQKAPAKIPDYAQGVKGLGHFSTVSSLNTAVPTQTAFYKQSYEAPTYAQYTQTERPFKASAFLGSSQLGRDSYSQQSIASGKPAGEYLPPSKTYLPAKEQYVVQEHYLPAKEHYAPAKEHYVPEQSPVEYEIQYIQAPSKSYIPPVANNYLPPKAAIESPKSSYLPPKKTYLPPVQQPTNKYLPANNPFSSSHQSNSQSSPSHYQASSHSAPSQYQQYQQFQPQEYESLEYQSVTPAGHHK